METTSLKAKIATFAAGALTVAMIPAGIAHENVGAMFGLKGNADAHVETSENDASLQAESRLDANADVRASHGNHAAAVRAAARTESDAHADVRNHGTLVRGVARDNDGHANGAGSSLRARGTSRIDADSEVRVKDGGKDTSANVTGSAHADVSGNVSIDEHDVGVDGSADASASVDANASHENDRDGSLNGLLEDLGLDLL